MNTNPYSVALLSLLTLAGPALAADGPKSNRTNEQARWQQERRNERPIKPPESVRPPVRPPVYPPRPARPTPPIGPIQPILHCAICGGAHSTANHKDVNVYCEKCKTSHGRFCPSKVLRPSNLLR
jgi:hypothetical protein